MPVDVSKVTKGRQASAPRVLIYANEGVGKTRFACSAPSPFVLDADQGSHAYDVDRVVPSSWTEAREWIRSAQVRNYKTIVLDSVTELELLSHKELFAGTTIDKYDGGYGKGDTFALMEWRSLLEDLDALWRKGMGIVLVAHAMTKRFEDPSGPGYERFEISGRPKVVSLLKKWCDYILFAREEIVPAGKGKAVTTGVRWAYTRRCPAYDAKSRGTSLFPERILLSWDEFSSAVSSEEARVKALKDEIASMLAEIGDAVLSGKVQSYVTENPQKLLEARNRVASLLEEARKKQNDQSGAVQGTSG